MRVLITNNTLDSRAGTEILVEELADGLRRRGHMPIAYSQRLGITAARIRALGIPVIDRLDDLREAPDIIHGQHHFEAMSAMLQFPDTPAIYVCHGWVPPVERPPQFANIMKYVAVSNLTRESVFISAAATANDVEIIPNSVDIRRFRRKATIAAVPRWAAVFSNDVLPGSPYGNAVMDACKQCGIQRLVAIGIAAGTATETPEVTLAQQDLVFATGRAALEALAVGCAVVVASPHGSAGLATPGNFDYLRERNFGLAALDKSRISVDSIAADIQAYDAEEIQTLAARVAREATLDEAVDRYLSVYEEAIGKWRTLDTASSEFAARRSRDAAAYLVSLAAQVKS